RNGTEEYLVLWNPSETAEATTHPVWHTDHPAQRVYDPKTGQPVDARIDGQTIHLSLTLQPLETLLLATQPVRPPAGTLSDWFRETSTLWKGSLPGSTVSYPDVPVYYQS